MYAGSSSRISKSLMLNQPVKCMLDSYPDSRSLGYNRSIDIILLCRLINMMIFDHPACCYFQIVTACDVNYITIYSFID